MPMTRRVDHPQQLTGPLARRAHRLAHMPPRHGIPPAAISACA